MRSQFDNPITLCSDCGKRADGLTSLQPFDGTDECKWCGDEVSGSKTVVEEQENPGPLPWQEDREELADWLNRRDNVDDVRVTDKLVDFTIGDMDEWPKYTGEDELNAIRSSRANLGFVLHKDDRFEKLKFHLPPGREELKDALSDTMDLPENFGVHYGTGSFGGMPAPDGVITPHVIGEDATLDEVKEVVEQCLTVYEDVYDGGEKVIKTKPE